MSDIKRFNTEKKTATLSKKDVHNLVLNYLQAFLN